MSIPKSTPTVQEIPFQMFVYAPAGRLGCGTYKEREGNKDLTEMQKNVRYAMRKYGNQAQAAKALGVSLQCVQGHVSLIESKGWSI